MNIFCVQCECEVKATLTDGNEIYPHRRDLSDLPFWKCPTCGNYVGTHYKTKNPTQPLGVIPNPEIRAIRSSIHAKLDPLWKSGHMSRSEAYRRVAKGMGIHSYHTANISNISEAKKVLEVVTGMINSSKG